MASHGVRRRRSRSIRPFIPGGVAFFGEDLVGGRLSGFSPGSAHVEAQACSPVLARKPVT